MTSVEIIIVGLDVRPARAFASLNWETELVVTDPDMFRLVPDMFRLDPDMFRLGLAIVQDYHVGMVADSFWMRICNQHCRQLLHYLFYLYQLTDYSSLTKSYKTNGDHLYCIRPVSARHDPHVWLLSRLTVQWSLNGKLITK